MNEEWRDIKGYEGLYQVSNLGRVRSLRFKKVRILKPWGSHGYKHIELCVNNSRFVTGVHRLVAEAFIPNIGGYDCVDHIDTNKENNKASNLRWCSHKENSNNEITKKHMKDWFNTLSEETVKKIRQAASKSRSKTIYMYDENKNFIKEFYNANEVIDIFKVSKTTIQRYCRNNKPIQNHILSYTKL